MLGPFSMKANAQYAFQKKLFKSVPLAVIHIVHNVYLQFMREIMKNCYAPFAVNQSLLYLSYSMNETMLIQNKKQKLKEK